MSKSAAQVEIAQVVDGPDLEAVRALCQAFRQGQLERYADQLEHINRYYGEEAYESTLKNLALLHAPPRGLILLARINGESAGCVMYAALDEKTCLMKRMFVAPEFRRHGVARALVKALQEDARASGYATMWLDTGPRQTEAVALYESLGFTRCAPQQDDGPYWEDKVYMICDLRAVAASTV